MLNYFQIKLSNNIVILKQEESNLVFKIGRDKLLSLNIFDERVVNLIYSLANQGLSEKEIEIELSKVSEESKNIFLKFLEKLIKNNLIDYCLEVDDVNKFIIHPYNETLTLKNFNTANKKFTLSRFAYLRKEKNGVALINPISEFYLSCYGVLLVECLIAITDKQIGIEVFLSKNNLNKNILNIFLICLLNANIITFDDFQEPENLKTWEFHDLLFHQESRLRKSSDRFYMGATYRFGLTPIEQPINRSKEPNKIALIKPEKNSIKAPSFFSVLEKRTSIRKHGNRLLKFNEISEFLYRSVGIYQKDKSYRPFPSSGGIYELEFYFVANLCDGLSKGIYYYDPNKHTLHEISTDKSRIDQLIKITQSAIGETKTVLQSLIVITSKFQKISWKYEGIAYRNTLMNVGAAIQTMYLVATAMNLAPCALGYGNSTLFSTVTGLDPLIESAVGEFTLGAYDL